MKKAVVTVTIGTDFLNQAQWSHFSFKFYAKKVKADFIVFDKRKFLDRDSVYEKFQIRDLIEQGYQRILYIDTDAFIKPNCPDIFNLVPYEQIGGVYDNKENEPANQDRTIQTQRILGDIEWERGYINAGIYIVSDIHKELFNIPAKTPNEGWWDQNVLNYNIHKFGFKIYKLDIKFNAMFLYGYSTNGKIEDVDVDAYIIHLAACGRRKERLKFLYERYYASINHN